MSDEHPTTALVSKLIRFLSTDGLSVEDVCARIGAIAEDPGGLLPIKLRSVMPGVETARLFRYPVTGWPYLVEIDLAIDARLEVGALEKLLGTGHPARTDRGMPAEVLFHPPGENPAWQMVVIAGLQSASGPQVVSRIAFRRDPTDEA